MRALQFHSHVGTDGVLKVEIPVGVTDTDLDVVVIVSPAETAGAIRGDWPPNFFEETFGALADHRFERPPQGEYETRDALK